MMKRKILSVILAFTMVVGMLPLTNLEVQAEEVNYTMALGMNAIENWDKEGSLSVEETDKIVMGTYEGTPVEWVKLNEEGLMFSTSSLGESAFESDGNGYYPGSTLNTAMVDLYDENSLGLTDEEKGAIVSTTLEEGSMRSNVGNLENQFFFPLSHLEFITYVGGYSALAKDSSIDGYWWFRTSLSDDDAYSVGSYGNMGTISVSILNSGVRPAFNLNLDSVLFTSASGAGKASTFSVVGSSNESDTWKLTLKGTDSDLNANVKSGNTSLLIGYSEEELTIGHSVATTLSDATQVSAMLVDSDETVLYYGGINASTSATSSTVTIPAGLAAGSYKLYVFAEDVNNVDETDYASAFGNAISITVTPIYDVEIKAGEGMTKTTDSGEVSQTGIVNGSAITAVVYTANEGYYFPEGYSVTSVNGIGVTLNSSTQITVSGTPTADAAIQLTAATAKESQSVPTDVSGGVDKIAGTTTAMEYILTSTYQGDSSAVWTTCTDSNTTVVAGTYYVRYAKTDIASAGEKVEVTVTAASIPTPNPAPSPIWTPSEDDLYRSSLVGWMPVEFTTSSVPYEFELINELQGPLCFDVFHAFRGDYIIGATYSSLVDDMRIQQLSQGITVTLQIPSSLQKENRSYEMICVHKDGNAVVLADLDTNPNTITFTTDKGYAFALCYKD